MIAKPRGAAANRMATAALMDPYKLLLGLILVAGVAAARRHQWSGLEPDRGGDTGEGRGPAWQARKNHWTKGTDLLDWSRDPRRVDPKVYTTKHHSNKCSESGMHWAYSMSGQLEGQEWHAGLVNGDQVEPKSKAQLGLCEGLRHFIMQDMPTGEAKLYLATNDLMLERDMPVESCSRDSECPKRGENCTTYRLQEPFEAEVLDGPISGNLSGRVESLLRDYGPMAVFIGKFELDKDGFLNTWNPNCYERTTRIRGFPQDNFLLVGYGRTDDDVGYFKFKTSRGPAWGDGGFGYIKYTSHKGYCGHLNGQIELWKIKPCKSGRRAGHSRASSSHRAK